MRWKQVVCAGLFAPVLGSNLACCAAHNLLTEPLTACSEQAITHELRKDARSAWREVRCQFPRRMFSEEFHDGFLDGYTDYLDRGGSGSLPAIPPARYTRHKKYFTPEGHALLKDYFLGFQYGVDVAIATNCRQFLTVPVLLPEKPTDPPAFHLQPGGVPAPVVGPAVDAPPPVVVPDPVTPAPVVVQPDPFGASPVLMPSAKPQPTPAPTNPKPLSAPRPVPDSGPTVDGSKFGPRAPLSPTSAEPDDMISRPVPPFPLPMPSASPIAIPALPDAESGSNLKFGTAPAVPRPDFMITLPEPPSEVPTLPAGIATPPIRDDLPVIRPNHSAPTPLPANHSVPGKD